MFVTSLFKNNKNIACRKPCKDWIFFFLITLKCKALDFLHVTVTPRLAPENELMRLKQLERTNEAVQMGSDKARESECQWGTCDILSNNKQTTNKGFISLKA